MTVDLLIHAIVRQTMILIAQLATAHGGRAPLAHVAGQVFLDLVRELERQGVSRKVSADMFGVGLRTYRRKIQRLSESISQRGRSLWEAIFEYVDRNGPVTRNEILERFIHDDEAQVRSVLRDLCESGLVMASGSGARTRYRPASREEMTSQRDARGDEGTDELLMALMYREGPLSVAECASLALLDQETTEKSLVRLALEGRIERIGEGPNERFHARSLFIPVGAESGWEAAVFDHFKAMVTTILTRLRIRDTGEELEPCGGSTYTMEIWPGHPLAEEVEGTLARVRGMLGDLRERVTAFNATSELPEEHRRVVVYVGQNVIDEGRKYDN